MKCERENVFEVLCRTLLGLHFSLVLVIAGCSVGQVKREPPEAAAGSNAIVYPDIDTELGEHLYPSEKPIAEKLSVVIEQSIRKQYAAGNARRDAHPKAHGCVKAEVHVLETAVAPDVRFRVAVGSPCRWNQNRILYLIAAKGKHRRIS